MHAMKQQDTMQHNNYRRK